MYQLTINLADFLAQYWQKQPTIIKGGFAAFTDPISPEELAGLSMEEEIDSRFVSNLDQNWHAEHGPFTEQKFAELADSHWSLIVQATNHWHAGAAELVEPFKALPQWLFDDLMVSYSVQGGGVGPHIDQYDVFIVQGMGKRHWRVGAKDIGQYKETKRHEALRQIESFDAIIDDVLEPGDILYIPPGFPHDGYALEPSLSYSVGFRSPKEQELVSNFADYVLAHDYGDKHMDKPTLSATEHFGQISTDDKETLTNMLMSALQDESTIKDFLGCMLSQSRHQLNIIEPEDKWSSEDVAQHLSNGGAIYKVAGLRALLHEEEPTMVYINGEVFKLPEAQTWLARVLTDSEVVVDIEPNSHVVPLLTELINKGYWFID
ncbi:cupin domain-containing protein [Vibrio variabilis]|uniref:cupin domain-containing protein n=1 Tax=Vibrio variabilis TaxID=990271 RepID=UPI000DDB0955|nr:cupin domain-containing protein [Vibrio variabilis]